jgi:hypothetical protein
VVLVDAARQSRESMQAQLEQLCAREVPGDTHRNLRISPSYSGETFKHILVPVWLLTYTYTSRAYQVVANGYTGRIAGRYPKSGWKIAGAVLLAIVVALIILLFAEAQ